MFICTFQDSKGNSDDKSKNKTDLSDKGAVSKKTPPTTTNAINQNSENKTKTHTPVSNGTAGTPVEKTGKTPEKLEKIEKTDKQVIQKLTHKAETKLVMDKLEKIDKLDSKSEKGERNSGDKTDRDCLKLEKERTKLEKLEKSEGKEKDSESRSDSKSEGIIDRKKGGESKNDYKDKDDLKFERESTKFDKESMVYERESTKYEKEKREKSDKSDRDLERDDTRDFVERDKENIVSYKETTSIPPIHPTVHSMQNSNTTTPSIPSLSRLVLPYSYIYISLNCVSRHDFCLLFFCVFIYS